jgi:sigma-B regulation protein RsbU (phosphoserine phosphatase)
MVGGDQAAMSAETEVVSLLRGQLADIISGTFFVLIGLIAFSIAAIRRRGGVRVLVWLGLWSAMFGVNQLAYSPAIVEALPHSFVTARPLLSVSFTYLIIVAAALAFLELTLGILRRFLQLHLIVDVAVTVAAIGWFLISGSESAFLTCQQLLAVLILLALLVTLSVPKLSRRFLVLSRHRVLTIGTLIFSAEALWVNIARPLRFPVPAIYSSLAFAVLLLSFGYVAMDMIGANERRLLSIDKELEIARQLQFSILPGSPPEVRNLRIAATYKPMTAVAGDFYEFLAMDEHRAGFLIADVSGHGVPAALIASMIKVAAQSVNGCAHDPAEVLRRLGSILSSHLRGQFVSAAYLWMDTAVGTALYSAAGHPPLLRWRKADASLTRIESNGLLWGVMPESDYPVCNIPFAPGDRFLLYTDGVTEPENAAGEAFGDRRLEQIVRDNQSRTASEFSQRLLAEVRAWQPASRAQQDDITLIVIDVV